MDVPIELCTSARVYRADPIRRTLFLIILIALYAISIPFCYFTAGEPRLTAMAQSQRLLDKKWDLSKSSTTMNGNGEILSSSTEKNLLDDIENELKLEENVDDTEYIPLIVDLDDEITTTSTILTEKQNDFFETNEILDTTESSSSSSSGNFISRWFIGDKEQKRAEKEFEKWKKDLKAAGEESAGELISLPPSYLPSAWACLSLFMTLSLHALFFLMGHWLVAFKAWSLYKPSTTVDENCMILVTPPPNRGVTELVSMKRGKSIGLNNMLYFEFQHQKYFFSSPSDLSNEDKELYPNGVFTLSSYPVNNPLSHYLEARGVQSDTEAERLTDKWGPNHLAVSTPGFFELLKLQLLSPLAIFQVFCALLWLIDDYWSYTMFTLFSVLMYEGTTVFQRTRTQKMLGGMSPKPTPVYVYRGEKWVQLTTKDLLPGDLVSLAFKRRAKSGQTAATGAVAPAGATVVKKSEITTQNEIIPCDCLLVRGGAVVNEASLTGESVPQMKESLNHAELAGDAANEPLDTTGMHRVHTLFSGTSLVTVTPGDESTGNGIPNPPDGGAIGYVLRTGFGSSQGALLQMIEFSQQSVSGDSKETGMALVLLFAFALVASGYVLKEGLRKQEKTTHELLIRCVIIITSVVPRQFPMQVAVAVNMALMALSKAGVFCTEPFRVPLSGKVSHCLFDKTGTITTDQLVPVGLVNYNSVRKSSPATDAKNDDAVMEVVEMTPVNTACGETTLILAACHSLVVVDDSTTPSENEPMGLNTNLTGDPIELAAIRAIEWQWDGLSSTAHADGAVKKMRWAVEFAELRVQKLTSAPQDKRPPTYAAELEKAQKELRTLREKLPEVKEATKNALFDSVNVVTRHHFSSALQRMSVVARCQKSDGQHQWMCLVKGSPEALQKLIPASRLPSWYEDTYESLARRGLRVLALAYKHASDKDNAYDQPRNWVESDLHFGGFIAFECKIRGDSAVVIRSLRESDHYVSMLTGDGLLTSLHVARTVGICDDGRTNISLACHKPLSTVDAATQLTLNDFYWANADGKLSKDSKEFKFVMSEIVDMSKKFNLLTTEDVLIALVEVSGGDVWKFASYFKVFARMSPHGKASVIRAIQEADSDNHVFMCGDGGNDVGALKQADVGLALLAGHANANTSEELNEQLSQTTASNDGSKKSAEDILNAHTKAMASRGAEFNKLRAAHMKEFQAKFTQEQQAKMQVEIQRLTAAGEYSQMFSMMKNQAAVVKQAMAEENQRFMAQHGHVWDPKKDGDGVSKTGIESMLDNMEGMDAGGLPMVRPGDASVAAPFTSRIPSIRAVVDLIRQGRCTLLSALMQQQIMMLESTISAYTLSALSLHNARSSERQMMASSWLLMTAGLAFSYASPIDQMHPLRPIRSLFHPSFFLSILGQAAIHIACMTLAVRWATDAMGEEKLAEVTEFFQKVRDNEIDRMAHCGEDDFLCQMQAYWMAPFLPNLLNSTVFLVETSQMISVYFVNYKGRPWMKGMLENHALFLSVFACIGGVIAAAWELVPAVNEMIQLAPFPTENGYRMKVLSLVISTIFGTFLWDRLCVLIFSPKVAKAMLDEARKTTLADFAPLFGTILKVAGVLAVLATNNILLGLAGYWMYRNYMAKQQQQQ